MKWIEITKLIELDLCPWCDESITEFTTTLTNRVMAECNNCGCKLFECNDKLWFKVPDKKSIKQKELIGYYGDATNKL